VWDVARQYGIPVIEDLAEAHGITPHPDSAAACWSFYKNKIIAGEEGGAILFRHPIPADRARSLRSLGFTPAHDYTHIPGGHNYRMANALARPIRLGLTEYTRNENLARRCLMYNLWSHYSPQEFVMRMTVAPWVYPFRVPRMTREKMGEVVRAIQGLGVEARFGFLPMTMQETYKGKYSGFGGMFDNRVSEVAGREVMYLPLLPVLDPVKVKEVMDTIIRITSSGLQ
jgi:dTDP-4-amino-4,6-dideoxygalactose transaminase